MPDIEENKEKEESKSPFISKRSDPGFLVAKGRFKGETDEERRAARTLHVKGLATAIFKAMSHHGYATIRSIGEAASYNAVKSIAIASGSCKSQGLDLCFEVSFDEGNLGSLRKPGHVEKVTAIVFSLKGYKEWAEDRKNE